MNPSIDSAASLSQPATTSHRQVSNQIVIGSVENEYGYLSGNRWATNVTEFVPYVLTPETTSRVMAQGHSVEIGGSATDYNYSAREAQACYRNSLPMLPQAA